MPADAARARDIALRGEDHLVIDRSGRVIWLKSATLTVPYERPPSAPWNSVVGQFPPRAGWCTLL